MKNSHPSSTKITSRSLVLAALAATGLASHASAQTTTISWTTNSTSPAGFGDSGNWSDTTKWTGGDIPDGFLAGGPTTRVENATFGAYANDRTVTLDNDYSINALTIVPRNSGFSGKNFTLSTSTGKTLTIGSGGVTIGTGGTTSVSINIALGADQTWTTSTDNVSNAASFTGTISGLGKLTRTNQLTSNSNSVYTYTGANTFSGGYVSSATSGSGLVVTQLGNSSVVTAGVIASGPLGTGSVTLNGGRLSSSSGSARTMNNNILVGGDAILGDASNAGALTFSDSSLTTASTFLISGASRTLTINSAVTINQAVGETGGTGFGLIKAGSSTLTLGGTNTYTGGTTINAGTLSLASAGALGTTGTITFGGGTLQSSATNTTDYSSRFSNAANQAYKIDTIGQTVAFGTGLSSAGGSLTKIGTGTLTLNAANSYDSGTTVAGGTLSLGNSGALGTTGTISFTGGTLQYGASNSTDYSSRIGSSTSVMAIDTNSQNVTFAGNLDSTNVGGLSKSGSGTLTLAGANAYAGATTISGGTLQTAVATNAFGSTTGIGISGTGTLALRGDSNTTFSNGTTAYAVSLSGSGATIDVNQATTAGTGQTFTLGTLAMAGAYTLNVTGNNSTGLTFGAVSGSTANDKVINNNLINGTLTLGGYSEANASARNLTVRGFGDTTIAGNITQNGANALSLTKTGSGTLTLTPSSANTFSGTISANGGRIVADYTNGDVLSGQAINLGGGTVEFKGKSTGTTADTVANIATTASTGLGTFVLNKNSGTSTTITAGTVTRNGTSALLFDLSQGGSITTTSTNMNGILVTSGIYTRTSSGYDFAVNNTNASGGTIVALASSTLLSTATSSTGASNFKLSSGDLTSGSYTLGSAISANTLRVDTAGGGTLNINTRAFTNTQILFTGNDDYALSGTSGAIASATSAGNLLVSHFGSGKLTVTALLGTTTGVVRFTGAGGLVDWNSAANQSGANDIFNNTVRLSASNTLKLDTTATLNGSGVINLASGGILELTSTDLTRNLVNASGGIQILGNGGFSAFNGTNTTRTVNLGSGAQMTWGSGGFASDEFILGSSYSNATLDFQNNIDLGSVARVVQVNNGIISGDVDGKLSGVISGAASFIKTGTGTLELSNANLYTGTTTVSAGILNISGSLASSAVSVNNTGTLLLSGASTDRISTGAAVTLNTSTLSVATGSKEGAAATKFAGVIFGSSSAGLGALTLGANATLNFDSTGNSTLLVFSSFAPGSFTLNITGYTNSNYNGGSNSGLATDDRLVFAADQTANLSSFNFGSGTTATQTLLDTGFYEIGFTAVPEPSTYIGGGLMLGLAAWSQRKRFGLIGSKA